LSNVILSINIRLDGFGDHTIPVAQKEPNATRGMINFAARYNSMPKIVFSHSLKRAEWINEHLIRGEAVLDERMDFVFEDMKSIKSGVLVLHCAKCPH